MWGLTNKTKLFSMYFSAKEVVDLEQGIRKRLNSFLLRFDEDLGGVMIEYSNLRLLEHQMHTSSNRTPYLHCEVVVDAIIFNPKPRKKLIGQVNHFSADFLSLLVYGVFNAAISVERIKGNFVKSREKWVNKDNKKEYITIGSWVIFEIVQVDKSAGIFGITGSMLQETSGPIMLPNKKQQNTSQINENLIKKAKKPKKRHRDHDGEEKKMKRYKKLENGQTQQDVDNGQQLDIVEILESSDNGIDLKNKKKDKKLKKKKKKEKKEKKQSIKKYEQQNQLTNGNEENTSKTKQTKHTQQV